MTKQLAESHIPRSRYKSRSRCHFDHYSPHSRHFDQLRSRSRSNSRQRQLRTPPRRFQSRHRYPSVDHNRVYYNYINYRSKYKKYNKTASHKNYDEECKRQSDNGTETKLSVEEILDSDMWCLLDEVLKDENIGESNTPQNEEQEHLPNYRNEHNNNDLTPIIIKPKNNLETNKESVENGNKFSIKKEATEDNVTEKEENKFAKTEYLTECTEQSTSVNTETGVETPGIGRSCSALSFVSEDEESNVFSNTSNYSKLSSPSYDNSLHNVDMDLKNNELLEENPFLFIPNDNTSVGHKHKVENAVNTIPSNPQFILLTKKIMKEWKTVLKQNEIDFKNKNVVNVTRQILRKRFLKLLKGKSFMKSKEIMKLFREKYPEEEDGHFIEKIIKKIKKENCHNNTSSNF